MTAPSSPLIPREPLTRAIVVCLDLAVRDHRFTFLRGRGTCAATYCDWERDGEFMACWEAHEQHLRGEKRFLLTDAALTAMEALADDLVSR
jgi:hypothetical protein